MLMRAVFGTSDAQPRIEETSAFHEARRNLIAAAVDYAENAQSTGFPMLRERFRSALIPLQTYLLDRGGVSLDQTDRRITKIFDKSQAVLKDDAVRGVFGIRRPIDAKWPLDHPDPNGAKLVEKITNQLAETGYGAVTLERFVRMQRIAKKGADPILGLFDPAIEKNDDKLHELIANVYAWGSELGMIRRGASSDLGKADR